MGERIPRVLYQVGDVTLLVTPEDKIELDSDLLRFGNLFVSCDQNGFGTRIDPIAVQFKQKSD